jgi:hypothetical protein
MASSSGGGSRLDRAGSTRRLVGQLLRLSSLENIAGWYSLASTGRRPEIVPTGGHIEHIA